MADSIELVLAHHHGRKYMSKVYALRLYRDHSYRWTESLMTAYLIETKSLLTNSVSTGNIWLDGDSSVVFRGLFPEKYGFEGEYRIGKMTLDTGQVPVSQAHVDSVLAHKSKVRYVWLGRACGFDFALYSGDLALFATRDSISANEVHLFVARFAADVYRLVLDASKLIVVLSNGAVRSSSVEQQGDG